MVCVFLCANDLSIVVRSAFFLEFWFSIALQQGVAQEIIYQLDLRQRSGNHPIRYIHNRADAVPPCFKEIIVAIRADQERRLHKLRDINAKELFKARGRREFELFEPFAQTEPRLINSETEAITALPVLLFGLRLEAWDLYGEDELALWKVAEYNNFHK
jgi:hypothetical protein